MSQLLIAGVAAVAVPWLLGLSIRLLAIGMTNPSPTSLRRRNNRAGR